MSDSIFLLTRRHEQSYSSDRGAAAVANTREESASADADRRLLSGNEIEKGLLRRLYYLPYFDE